MAKWKTDRVHEQILGLEVPVTDRMQVAELKTCDMNERLLSCSRPHTQEHELPPTLHIGTPCTLDDLADDAQRFAA